MHLIKRLSSRNFFVFNLVLLGALFGFSLAFLSFSCSTPSGNNSAHAETSPVVIPTDALAAAEGLQSAFRSVADAVLPVVVQINTVEVRKQQVPNFNGIPWEFFFGTPDDEGSNEREYRSSGLGSGVIVRRDGSTYYVVTNNHVVGEAAEISIAMYDGEEYSAELVGTDPRKDLAIVSFSMDTSHPLAVLGDSETVKVGDWAIAVGHPLGLTSSVTMGIVSAVGRTGGPAGNINDFIQTDAAINQGNSGGALVNIKGEVIGINTWIASPSGGNVGLGFAIPINNIKKAVDDIINNGQVRYGWLGVSLIDVDKDLAEDLGLEGQKGALASQVFMDSPAEKGGMLPGDFITGLNGNEVRGRDQLVLAVGNLVAGEDAVFTVIRNGEEQEIQVRIDERRDEVAAENNKLWPGIIVIPLTDEIKARLGLEDNAKGLYVADSIAKTAAAAMGVQRGDRILGVNGEKVESVSDFYRVLNEKAKEELWFEIIRGDSTLETMRYKR